MQEDEELESDNVSASEARRRLEKYRLKAKADAQKVSADKVRATALLSVHSVDQPFLSIGWDCTLINSPGPHRTAAYILWRVGSHLVPVAMASFPRAHLISFLCWHLSPGKSHSCHSAAPADSHYGHP